MTFHMNRQPRSWPFEESLKHERQRLKPNTEGRLWEAESDTQTEKQRPRGHKETSTALVTGTKVQNMYKTGVGSQGNGMDNKKKKIILKGWNRASNSSKRISRQNRRNPLENKMKAQTEYITEDEMEGIINGKNKNIQAKFIMKFQKIERETIRAGFSGLNKEDSLHDCEPASSKPSRTCLTARKRRKVEFFLSLCV